MNEYFNLNLDGRGFKSHQLHNCIRGRVVEGTGLIIRFPLERHWFEPSRMHISYFLYCFFQTLVVKLVLNKCLYLKVIIHV